MRINDALGVLRTRFAQLVGLSHGGHRDFYQVFGYPRDVTPDMLYAMYLRGGLASRIIRAFPQATWREEPVIRDEAGDSSEKDSESYSVFVEAVENFFEEKNLWRVIERADRLASIGRFGIILLGFNDGKQLSEPLVARKPKLLYASAYGEPNVQVVTWDTNPMSPRFGLPVQYSITQDFSALGSTAPTKTLVNVHYTRVIHIAEFLDSDDAYGVPRLLPVYNHLLDLDKVVGGAAETFWLAANRGIALWADKEASLSEEDVGEIKKQADEFQHQLRRYLVGSGMTAQVLGADSPDPGPNADRLIDLIAGATGIPKRILLGTERGELSSAQDENNWSARVDERRRNFASPMILKPLVQRLIDTGNLPKPKGVFWVEWPQIVSLDPVQKSTVALNRANAIATYVRSPGIEMLVPPQEFRRDILELPPESEYDIPDEWLEDDLDDTNLDAEGNPIPPDGEEEEGKDEPEVNAEKRTLYVRRDVKNKAVIMRWARSQGLTDINDDLHVTIVYSRKPVDWMKAGEPFSENITIEPGGPRMVEGLGEDGSAIALLFASNELQWRHESIRELTGAEHHWPEYQPHITITNVKPDFDLKAIKPYTGAIVLGPEIYEEVKED